MKVFFFSRHHASLKILISTVQDFGNFELPPMCIAKSYWSVSMHFLDKLTSLSECYLDDSFEYQQHVLVEK